MKTNLISMEDLNIKGMFQNDKWSPKLQQISLYKLVEMIRYKAEWYGKKFIQIDSFFPSTKKCNKYRYIYKNITPDICEWECLQCGQYHHRDVNAAINIKTKEY